MNIRVLPSNIVNQIAAGEVIERPAAVVKELVENSIDAKSTAIDVVVNNGGKTFISITDNGVGIAKDDLPVALQRHATSKLNTEDLFNINYLGFRGEALPSIASVARMTITSRVKNADAYEIVASAGNISEVVPASLNEGTRIEVKDLFFSVPARLKFLKTDATEVSHTIDSLNRIALSHPETSFSLTVDGRLRFSYPVTDIEGRIAQIMGDEFIQNMCKIERESGNFKMVGYVSLPTFTKGTSASQYMFVNGRSVKDKLLHGTIRAGYEGYIGRDIYPAAVIFLQIDNKEVDVNVHPAKSEVRFREPSLIRGIIVSATKQMLQENAGVVASSVVQDAVAMFAGSQNEFQQRAFNYDVPLRESSLFSEQSIETYREERNSDEPKYPLGFAKAQLYNTYIVAQSDVGIVIVDQHASHERITYEKISKDINSSSLAAQMLLIPEVVDVTYEQYHKLMSFKDEFKDISIVFDSFGENSIVVRELPAILGQIDIKALMEELADGLLKFDDNIIFREKLKDICAIMSCHGSIRAGRKLSIDEMNALLREIEANPNTAQCIHGRPTYIKLELKDIERLFGRR